MKSYHILVNRDHPLKEKLAPKDLVLPDVLFAPGSVGEKRLMRKEAAYYLEKLFVRAQGDGIQLAAVSGYRSFERQRNIYQTSLRRKGLEHTQKYIAVPGCSEHQTGLAMDVSCKCLDYELEEEFETTKEGVWLNKNASLFGFVIRYPKNKEGITGYAYEPWHIRYVTCPLAYYLNKMGITLEEYYAQMKV